MEERQREIVAAGMGSRSSIGAVACRRQGAKPRGGECSGPRLEQSVNTRIPKGYTLVNIYY